MQIELCSLRIVMEENVVTVTTADVICSHGAVLIVDAVLRSADRGVLIENCG